MKPVSGPVYDYDLGDFLLLEPDEVAAAILPAVKAQQERSGQVSGWNVLNDARIAHGEAVAQVVAEGWQWLLSEGFVAPSAKSHGDWYVLTRRGRTIDLKTHVADARAFGLLRTAKLDPHLQRAVLPTFRRGQYDLGVVAAMREVEDRVRHASRVAGKSGVDLMRAAFGTGGPLDDPTLAGGERKARADLFAGAFGVHRNPSGHQAVDYSDPQEAAEAVLLANNLLRHLARAEHATRRPGRLRRGDLDLPNHTHMRWIRHALVA